MPETAGTVCSGADFCQELAGCADTEFRRTYIGDPESRIICRSPNLSLVADLSPLAAGHLLLLSNRHYLSFGEVLSDHAEEVGEAFLHVFDRYAETFGDPVVLEHGSSRSMDGSACIAHAHLHLLPLRLDAAHEVMTSDGLSASELPGMDSLRIFGDQGLPYFYCGNRAVHRVYGVSRVMRRQYLRSVAGRLLGMADPEWDYAIVVRRQLLRATMAKTVGWTLTSS